MVQRSRKEGLVRVGSVGMCQGRNRDSGPAELAPRIGVPWKGWVVLKRGLAHDSFLLVQQKIAANMVTFK
jgi:hypothetical protein